MGKFNDVLEKMAKWERLKDTPETLPSPKKPKKTETDEAVTDEQYDTTAESDSAPDKPNLFVCHERVSAEVERQEADESATHVQYDETVEFGPGDPDTPDPIAYHDRVSAEVENQEADESATYVQYDETVESGSDYPNGPDPMAYQDRVYAEVEGQAADESATYVQYDETVESGHGDPDVPDPMAYQDRVSAEVEDQEADESATHVQYGETVESDLGEPGAPDPIVLHDRVSAEAEKEETDKFTTSVKLDPSPKSELIRLTKLWPFVYHDPVSAEAEKQATDLDAKRVQNSSIPESALVHPVDRNLVVYHAPNSVEAEIFKVLRTNILFPKDGTPPPSVMVTSALPGDGKSFIASNLAVSIAKGIEEYVLLMDCDMRRSTIHKIFGFDDNIPGLSEYLSKGAPLPALMKKTIIKKLTILPGGRTPSNPSELLSSQRMKDLLEETKKRYKDRFIIVDSPPPQLTAETTALAKYVDGIVIVVRSGKTPKPLVDALIEKLGREKILGVVLNGHQMPATERYGYGRYNLHNYEYRKDRE